MPDSAITNLDSTLKQARLLVIDECSMVDEPMASAIGAEVVVMDPLAFDWSETMRGAADAIDRSLAPRQP